MVDYDPLAAVTDVETAWPTGAAVARARIQRGAHVLLELGRRRARRRRGRGTRRRFVNQRVAPVPMEGNGIAVEPHDDGSFTVWVSTQVPFDVRDDLIDLLGVGKESVRTIAPDVGGGFGAKLQVYPEYLAVAAAAARLGRSVRWIESRNRRASSPSPTVGDRCSPSRSARSATARSSGSSGPARRHGRLS